jgi:hypothetical protein
MPASFEEKINYPAENAKNTCTANPKENRHCPLKNPRAGIPRVDAAPALL